MNKAIIDPEDAQAIKLIETVLALRENGITDTSELVQRLQLKFHGEEEDFLWALELISTGAFRSAIMSSGKDYPTSNLKTEDHPLLRNSFRIHWIQNKGEAHYKKHYLSKLKPWWKRWKW